LCMLRAGAPATRACPSFVSTFNLKDISSSYMSYICYHVLMPFIATHPIILIGARNSQWLLLKPLSDCSQYLRTFSQELKIPKRKGIMSIESFTLILASSCSDLSIRTLAMLYSIELINGSGESQEVYCKPNCHTNMEYLMRMAPDIKVTRFPSLCHSQRISRYRA